MNELIPVTRNEKYIDGIVNDGDVPLVPATRIEKFLDAIYKNEVCDLTPRTRNEFYLAKISGQDVELPVPKTHAEFYLAAIAGEDVELPVPKTRIEKFLADWAEGSGLPDGYTEIAGITFDGNFYYKITDFFLTGADTMKVSFSATKACNIIGCYTSTSAQNNYSIYASTTAGAKYLRYNGGTYHSEIDTGKRYDITMTPTGATGFAEASTWTQKDFTADSDLCIGTTSPSATSAKLTGVIYGPIIIKGKMKLLPCKRTSDGVIGYHDGTTFWTKTGSGTPAEYTL